MQILIGTSIWAMGWNMLSASQPTSLASKFIYDMETGGEQSGYIETESGGEIMITVKEVEESFQTGSYVNGRAKANQKRTYIIKGSQTLLWEASYKITVSNELINKSYEFSVSAFAGAVSQKKLIRESSNKRACLGFKVSPYIGSDRVGRLVSTICGNKIVVSP